MLLHGKLSVQPIDLLIGELELVVELVCLVGDALLDSGQSLDLLVGQLVGIGQLGYFLGQIVGVVRVMLLHGKLSVQPIDLLIGELELVVELVCLVGDALLDSGQSLDLLVGQLVGIGQLGYFLGQIVGVVRVMLLHGKLSVQPIDLLIGELELVVELVCLVGDALLDSGQSLDLLVCQLVGIGQLGYFLGQIVGVVRVMLLHGKLSVQPIDLLIGELELVVELVCLVGDALLDSGQSLDLLVGQLVGIGQLGYFLGQIVGVVRVMLLHGKLSVQPIDLLIGELELVVELVCLVGDALLDSGQSLDLLVGQLVGIGQLGYFLGQIVGVVRVMLLHGKLSVQPIDLLIGELELVVELVCLVGDALLDSGQSLDLLVGQLVGIGQLGYFLGQIVGVVRVMLLHGELRIESRKLMVRLLELVV